MNSIKVEIITIGDEILIGQIVDTNSAWMAAELNKTGFEVAQITSVHDDASHIIDAIELALKRSDVVLFTGGIGPTKDDITKQTLCKYFNTKLVYNESVFKNIEQLLKNRSRAMNELTATQAMVPENCIVIQNTVGTAPITWFDKDEKVIVSMPGVPNEMKNAMLNEVIPRLHAKFNTPHIVHKTLIVQGYPESALALKIADWENSLPENLHLAFLPNYGIVKLRLSSSSNDASAIQLSINKQIELLDEILGNAIIAYEDISLEQLIGNLLISNGKTVSIAESCTGGNIAHKITLIPGCSGYFKGAVVAYANEAKINVLKVDAELIQKYGAVSLHVVEKMAIGVRELMNSDYSIATSGIAGPDGGTEDKPVGTVCISISCKDKTISKEFVYGSIREQNIERTTQTAFLLFKEFIY